MKYPILCNCKMKNLNSEIYFILSNEVFFSVIMYFGIKPVIHVNKGFFLIASKELFVH